MRRRGWIYSTPRFKKGARRHSILERPTRSFPFISSDRKDHSCRKGDLFEDTSASRLLAPMHKSFHGLLVIRSSSGFMDAGKRVNWTERRNETSRRTTRQRTYGILGQNACYTFSL